MKARAIITILSAQLFLSCESHTGTGVLVGGAVGAGTGALIGGGEGALIGGAAGVIAGGLVGAALDEQDRKAMEQNSPNTMNKLDRGQQLNVQDVINMSRNGLSDEVIINQINVTKSVFHLSSNQIIEMRNQGVSERVINYMIDTGEN